MLFAPISEPFVIDERRGIVALFKPRGWHSVKQADGKGRAGDSMVEWIATHARELPSCELNELIDAASSKAAALPGALRASGQYSGSSGNRFASEFGMLYRLDFETSGIMLFALTRAVFERMTRAQEERALEKRYVLVCSASTAGVPGSMPVSRACEGDALLADIGAGNAVRVESYFRGYGMRGARVACIAPDFLQKTRKPTTENLYETRLLKSTRLSGSDAGNMLLEASIRKGFRHQIRAHSAWMGLPIVGDPIYGGAPAERLMLEAHAVAFMDEGKIAEAWILHEGIDAESDEGRTRR